MSKSHSEVSKFLSYVLRHQPEVIGLALDSEGWADIDTLIRCAYGQGRQLDRPLIEAVVATSDKKRFAISADGSRIRAVQGHSSQQVDIRFSEKIPPEMLFHGTATRFIEGIRQQGLLAGSRQYVHLSGDSATATEVGKRHGKPVVLKIDARSMHEQGITFYQADNGVWLVEAVPPGFIGW